MFSACTEYLQIIRVEFGRVSVRDGSPIFSFVQYNRWAPTLLYSPRVNHLHMYHFMFKGEGWSWSFFDQSTNLPDVWSMDEYDTTGGQKSRQTRI